MLKSLLASVFGHTPLNKKLPPPSHTPEFSGLSQVFSEERAIKMEAFARQSLHYTGDFTSLRSVVDLAACNGKLDELNQIVPLAPQDFVRRHSASGRDMPEDYFTTGISNIIDFLHRRGETFVSLDLLQPFLPDGRSLAQLAYGTECCDALLGPKKWQSPPPDYNHLIRQLWGNDPSAKKLMKELIAREADQSDDAYLIRHIRRLQDESGQDPVSPAYIKKCLRLDSPDFEHPRHIREQRINVLFKEKNENGESLLEMALRLPDQGKTQALMRTWQNESAMLRTALFHMTREQFDHPLIMKYISGSGVALQTGSVNGWNKHVLATAQSPLDEPWLLTAERLGWGEHVRGMLQTNGESLTLADLSKTGVDGKSYLELITDDKGSTYPEKVIHLLGKFKTHPSAGSLLAELLPDAGQTANAGQFSLTDALANGLIGATVELGLTGTLLSVLLAKGYQLTPALLQTPLVYPAHTDRSDGTPANTLDEAMQVPNTMPLDLQMQLLGPNHVKAQIPMLEASEISQYPDFLKSLSTQLSPTEMCNLLTQDRKPILQVLLDHDALETSVVQNWINTPADLLSRNGGSSPYQILQSQYSPAKLLRVEALVQAPELLPEVVGQTIDIETVAAPLTSVFTSLAGDLQSGKRNSADIGFTPQDWLAEAATGYEPLIMKAARGGLFLPLRTIFSYDAHPLKAAELQDIRTEMDSLCDILKDRREISALVDASEWGDDAQGYLDFRSKMEGPEFNREEAQFQFCAARLKSRHRALGSATP